MTVRFGRAFSLKGGGGPWVTFSANRMHSARMPGGVVMGKTSKVTGHFSLWHLRRWAAR